MKTKLILLLSLFVWACPVQAGTSKVIKLKDGTTLIGEITSMTNGRYSVKTENLGVVNFTDEDVLSIQSPGVAAENSPLTGGSSSSLKQQVQSVQAQVMNDETIMESISELAEDREIQQLLQNPQLMNTIMTFDEQQIANDPAIQKLLERKDIQEIIKQIESKVGPLE
jgi:hypothetical protein